MEVVENHGGHGGAPMSESSLYALFEQVPDPRARRAGVIRWGRF